MDGDIKMNSTLIDLKKAHGRVPRYVVHWCFRKMNELENTVRKVRKMFRGAKKVVRTKCR